MMTALFLVKHSYGNAPQSPRFHREITLKCSKSSSSLSCSQKRRMFRAFNTTPSTGRRATLSWTLCPWGSLWGRCCRRSRQKGSSSWGTRESPKRCCPGETDSATRASSGTRGPARPGPSPSAGSARPWWPWRRDAAPAGRPLGRCSTCTWQSEPCSS